MCNTQNIRFSFFIVCFIGLFVAACDEEKTTGNQITGRISVENGTPDGVIVELYDEPNHGEGSAWWTASREPAVGFRYSATAAFDWRSEEARTELLITSTEPRSDGRFTLPEQGDGDYILVARKPGYGWTNPMEVRVRGGAVDIPEKQLYPDSVFDLTSEPINTVTTWEGGRWHYVLEADLIIGESGMLIIEPGAVVRLAEGRRIRVFGGLECVGQPEDFIVFTSMEDVPSEIYPRAGDWWHLRYYDGASPPLFRYVRFEYAEEGLSSFPSGATVEECFLNKFTGTGVSVVGDGITVRRNVFSDVPICARLASAYNVSFERNIIHNANIFALQVDTLGSGSIFCNWFYNCSTNDTFPATDTGVMNLTHVFTSTPGDTIHIANNTFMESRYALYLGSFVDSTVFIHHNHFEQVFRVMNVGVTEDRRGPSNPVFHFNVMEGVTSLNIFIHTCTHNYLPIDGRYNYWSSMSQSFIQAGMIHDCEDDPICQETGTCVDIEPIVTEYSEDTVGVCSN